MWHPISFIFVAGVLGAAGAAAQPRLEMPVACDYGRTCFIQNYFDHDPGPGRIDYDCGRLSYDGHDGTDIRVRDLVDMAQGFVVSAAAPGIVRGVRDGMADVSIRDTGPDAVQGREAGNGVVIEHGDGWETQYSHLRRGSVAVRPGQRVDTGDPLGLIGLSGFTEFPHLHFSVRQNGAEVDPFTGATTGWSCGDPGAPLWTEAAGKILHYMPTGLLTSGFSDVAPNADGARAGAFRLGEAIRDPDALVFWVDIFGAEIGDLERITIEAPDGTEFGSHEAPLAENNVSWFAFSGKRRPETGWQPGTYRARYQLLRDGAAIIDHARSIAVLP